MASNKEIIRNLYAVAEKEPKRFRSLFTENGYWWDVPAECLDHVIVLGEAHLRWVLKRYFRYYLNARTHLSLAKDAPEPRAIQRQGLGRIVGIPEVGGLHHRYERRAA